MLIVLSPAKRLDLSEPPLSPPATQPRLAGDTASLAVTTRRLTKPDLRRLMSISPDLAALNRERFQAFDPDPAAGTIPAAFAFAGDVYQGLQARRLDADAMGWAQDRLRILSGMYGVLRPLDRIQPYRLEMGISLHTRRGKTLYDFWDDRISRQLNADAEGHADPTLINLASQEYFGAVDRKALKLPIVTAHFLEEDQGERRLISFFAKKARGLMARWIIDHRVDRATDARGFDSDGYRFDAATSNDNEWTFVRPAVTKAATARRAAGN